MNNFPSNRVLIYSVFAILLYLSIDFYIKGKRDFFQLQYSWSTLEITGPIYKATLDSISNDYVKLEFNKFPEQLKVSSDETYALNGKYYFRCASISRNYQMLSFRGVHWINIIPKAKNGAITLTKVKLDLNQEGEQSVCMVGDSQLTWLSGKYTRKKIAEKFEDFRFVGNHSDVFNFPYEATLLNTTDAVLKTIDGIPLADIYIVYIGAHEEGVKNTGFNLTEIIQHFTNLGSKVIWIKPLGYLPLNKQNTVREMNKASLELLNTKNVEIIDLSAEIKEPQNYLMEDGIHLNALGHEFLVDLLYDKLTNPHQ